LQLSHQLNIKIPTLQNPEVQRRAAVSTGSINGSITKLIALSKQYQGEASPILLQEIRQTGKHSFHESTL
jgi:citrate lyase synthetase